MSEWKKQSKVRRDFRQAPCAEQAVPQPKRKRSRAYTERQWEQVRRAQRKWFLFWQQMQSAQSGTLLGDAAQKQLENLKRTYGIDDDGNLLPGYDTPTY